MADLFVLAAEPSGDLHGANLIRELKRLRPNLKIAAVAGPKMRELPIDCLFPMESLQVMGFTDVAVALPRIARQFFAIRKAIVQANPKAVVCIDYPGFNLRLERSLRKKNYQGKLIHYICPTVWAWGKKRIPKMAETLDLLLAILPFEKKCFEGTSLRVEYVGHPLSSRIDPEPSRLRKPILALFPGSRTAEIERNFPLQIAAAKTLRVLDSSIEIAVSAADPAYEPLIRSQARDIPFRLVPASESYALMKEARLAIATSGTVCLELALHRLPTVVNYAIRPFDVFLAQKIFGINLPFYCIVNILLSKRAFPELFGPNLSAKTLAEWTGRLWFDGPERRAAEECCSEIWETLGRRNASREAAEAVMSLAF